MWLFMGTVWAATLAVLPFDNHTGVDGNDALGVGVADMLVTDLGHVEALELVERARLRDVLAELELAKADFLDPATAARAGQGVGAEWILVGALSAVDPDVRLDARVVDVATGKVVHTASASGPRESFFDVEKDLALAVAEELGVDVSPREASRVGRVATESFEAFAAWSNGLAALDSGEVERAREQLEHALTHDSGFRAATTALDGLRGSLERADAVRQDLIDADLSQIGTHLDAFERGELPREDLATLLAGVSRRLQMIPLAEQREIGLRVLGFGLEESFVGGTGRSVNEWAMSVVVTTSDVLRDRTAVLAWGEKYVQRYPQGPYYQGIRAILDRLLDRIDKEEKARAAGVVETLSAVHRGEMLEQRCRKEPRLSDRPAHCAAWLEFLKDRDDVDPGDLERVAMEARRGADPVLMARVERVMTAKGIPASAIEVVAEKRVGLEERLAGVPERVEALEERIRTGATISRSRLESLADLGHYDAALRLAGKAGERLAPRERFRLHWSIAVMRADIPALGALIEKARERDDLEDPERLERALADVQRARAETDQADARRLEELADDLADADLNREAAETLDTLVAEWPDYYELGPDGVLYAVASAWGDVYEAGSVDRARAYYQQIVDDHPESRWVGLAKVFLSRPR